MVTTGAPNQAAIVTGGGRGMGLACARRLAATHQVVIVDIAAETAKQAADELSRAGAIAVGAACDVRDAVGLAQAVATAGNCGPLTAVVHAAGVSPTMADWRTIIDVDLCGTARVAEAVLPALAPGAAMVCFASIAGQVAPVPDDLAALLDEPLADGFLERFASLLDGNEAATGTAYGLAKHGVMRFCEREAPAFGERGARIVSISPGLITDTPQGKQELAEQPAMPVMIDMTPLKRGGRADEIAAVVEFACSPAASFLSGCDLRVDGGCVAAIRTVGWQAPMQMD